MRVLVTGSSGLLGEAVLKAAPKEFNTIAQFHHQNPAVKAGSFIEFDLEDTETIITFLDRQKPEAVIHLAAMSETNLCNQHPDRSAKLNITSSFIIARWCQQHQTPFIFSSTDLVFDGENPPYKETDKPNPLMVYGQHKWMAEKKIMHVYNQATICRLPLMYGITHKKPGGVLKFILDSITSGEDTRFFRDEFRTPVSTTRVATAIWMLLRKRLTGLYHLGGPQRISRYHLSLLVSEVFNIDSLKIKAGWLAETELAGKRPKDVTLDSSKAIADGYNPGDLNEDMREVYQELKFIKKYN